MDSNTKFWTEFIELYREHSCLWNVKSNDYSNKHKRNASYEIMLNKFKEINSQATLEVLKNKINNMRTAFRRELKKVQDSKVTGTATDDVYEPTLWYYDLLLFTAKSKTDRKGRETNAGENEQLEINNTMKCESISESEFASLTPVISLDDLESQAISAESCSTSHFSRSSASLIGDITRKRNINKRNRAAFKNKKRHVLKLAHNALSGTSRKDEDEYSIAGKRIGYQLKGVDGHQRTIAEKLISDVIFYAKLGKLTESSIVYCNGPPTHKPQLQNTQSS